MLNEKKNAIIWLQHQTTLLKLNEAKFQYQPNKVTFKHQALSSCFWAGKFVTASTFSTIFNFINALIKIHEVKITEDGTEKVSLKA